MVLWTSPGSRFEQRVPSPPTSSTSSPSSMATAVPASSDMPLRTQSVRTRRPPVTATTTPTRADPTPHSESLTRVDGLVSRSDSVSRPEASSVRPHRRASPRTPSHNNSGSPRNLSAGPPPEMPSAGASPVAAGSASTTTTPVVESKRAAKNRYRTAIPAPSGNYVFLKTIGQGSMGKVKLAKKEGTNEQVACKIIERVSPDDGRQSREDREKADMAREVRNAREAAIVSLLNHPYICGLRDNLRTKWHWYMLFEYVNGGQMLDYIISHGKLKEKQARKFARQIASAVDYCHRNSIVHRDLKIENILIHKNGDIKIIDFGLSNLFMPDKLLQTFCGSLYFAAPELLQARPYTGPEVDVWSFGVVLFVLVCGKVPFDDQYMPALHAKIKKGQVDYPSWLSSECKQLISRMLVTDPKNRATMQEVMNHAWMLKGYNAPPENHLPSREPLTLPLDPDVIQAMTGFGFGSPDDISNKLAKIIESRRYQQAVGNYEKERETPLYTPKDAEKNRGFGGLFAYKRRNSVTSRETLNASCEGLKLGEDPINAFHPMISIYYLVREKQDRDRKPDAKKDASSSSKPPPPPPSPQETPRQPPPVLKPKEKHSMADITPPQPAHTDPRTRHRARSHSEDQAREPVKNGLLSTDAVPAKKEGNVAGLLRRLSTRAARKPRLDPADLESSMPMPRGAVSMRATKSLGHARRESIQARRAKREAERDKEKQEQRGQSVKEETDAEVLGRDGAADGHADGLSDARGGGDADNTSAVVSQDRIESRSSDPDLAKPVFLKGIFSVSTTSTKPLPLIRADIKRVLKLLGVGFAEIKGGFNCVHAPSVVDDPGAFEPTVPGGEIRFEILIVKVPILSLHGVQFKRVGGNTWQYKNMAEQIVKELRL